MTVRSLALLSLLAATVVSTGCNIRGSTPVKQPSADDLAALQNENARLSQQNKLLADELEKNKGGTLAEDPSIAGGDIEGFERTASGGVALPEDFAFAKGSAELNEEGKKAVGRLAQRLNDAANSDKQIFVEGHTDHTPVSRATTKEKYTDNWGLSAARSAEVVRALEASGVNPLRLHGAFRGEFSPRVAVAKDSSKKDDATGEAANRRVEIHLSK